MERPSGVDDLDPRFARRCAGIDMRCSPRSNSVGGSAGWPDSVGSVPAATEYRASGRCTFCLGALGVSIDGSSCNDLANEAISASKWEVKSHIMVLMVVVFDLARGGTAVRPSGIRSVDISQSKTNASCTNAVAKSEANCCLNPSKA